MPDYEFHRSLGKKAGLIIGVLSGLATLLYTFDIFWGISGALIGYYSTVLGSVAPDVDSSQSKEWLEYSSKPYKKLVGFINFIIITTLTFVLIEYNSNNVGIESIMLSAGLVGITVGIIRIIPDLLHSIMPKHRGLTHYPFVFWIPMSIVSAYSIYWLLSLFEFPSIAKNIFPVIIGVSILTGAVTHILSDSLSTAKKTHAPELMEKTPDWVPRKFPIIFDIIPLSKIAINKQAPVSIRLLVIFTIGYALYPFDLIPNIIPVIGWVDDFSIYLYLRHMVYNGFQEDLTLRETLQREFDGFKLGVKIGIMVWVMILISAIGSIIYILHVLSTTDLTKFPLEIIEAFILV